MKSGVERQTRSVVRGFQSITYGKDSSSRVRKINKYYRDKVGLQFGSDEKKGGTGENVSVWCSHNGIPWKRVGKVLDMMLKSC